MKKLLIIILSLIAINVHSEVLFQDDFNDHSDWSPTQPVGGSNSSQDGDSTTACTGCPDGAAKYAGYRVERTAFTDGRIGEDTIQINSDQARSGKSYMLWTEPVEHTVLMDWTNDGQLVVQLNDTYETIYVRYYIKFDSSWVWDDDAGSSMKMGHTMNTSSGGSYFSYFKGGDNWPIALPFFGLSAPGFFDDQGQINVNIRKQSCYYPEDGYNTMPDSIVNDYYRYGISTTGSPCTLGDDCSTWANSMQDGNWHSFEYMQKGNSAMGVSDGEWHVWYDGDLIISKTDIPWADRGQNADGLSSCTDCTGTEVDPPDDFRGWTVVTVGGNANIERYAASSSTDVEQWYSIDDLVISTTYIGPDDPGSSSIVGPGTSSTFEVGTTSVIN